MFKKNLFVILVALFLVFSATVVSADVNLTADGKVPGGPFKSLQDQIDNLVLNPGPEGPQGETGATGATGPAGADGLREQMVYRERMVPRERMEQPERQERQARQERMALWLVWSVPMARWRNGTVRNGCVPMREKKLHWPLNRRYAHLLLESSPPGRALHFWLI